MMKMMKTAGMLLVFILGVALLVAGCSSGQQVQGTPRVIDDGNAQAQEVPPSPSPPAEAQVREISVRAFQWGFEPSTITVKKDEAVRLMITSSDVKHGFAIPEYGFDVQLSPGKTVPVEFVADKPGTFTAYCSVPCGAGHPDMKAKLVVE
ncbi:cupredoxin domain-containing protein [Candidatus Woesearchaeota archaeon]|nr:cupredoxin domain-containing protein [Candidatus Woesearchaeota archaeon]